MPKPKRETAAQKKARHKAQRERVLTAMSPSEREAYMRTVNGTRPGQPDYSADYPEALPQEGGSYRRTTVGRNSVDAND